MLQSTQGWSTMIGARRQPRQVFLGPNPCGPAPPSSNSWLPRHGQVSQDLVRRLLELLGGCLAASLKSSADLAWPGVATRNRFVLSCVAVKAKRPEASQGQGSRQGPEPPVCLRILTHQLADLRQGKGRLWGLLETPCWGTAVQLGERRSVRLTS